MSLPAHAPQTRWITATVLAAILFGVYSANGREIGAADTIPSLMLPVAILRGDGLRLDRFRGLWPNALPYYVAEKRGQIVSRYPLGPPLLALPFTAPQLAILDRRHPDWERTPQAALHWVRKLGKTSAAGLAALTGAALYLLLSALDLGRVALPATLIAALGSNLWMTGSQSLWQHGAAALSLTLALALLTPPPRRRHRLVLAGAACAALVYSRPQDTVLTLLILLWVVRRYRGAALWFMALPIVLGALLVTYNVWYFGRLLGGYHELVLMASPETHGTAGFWTTDVGAGALGTLLSPNRGLFIFTPWIPLTLAVVPALVPRLRRWPLICTALWGLPLFFAQLAVQATWWAGWSFGPRYWTDVMPLYAILLGFALNWARTRSRALFGGLVAAGLIGVTVQAIGAFCYPSSWNSSPSNVDRAHERLWDWRDTELARCLHEGTKAWE